MDIFADYQNERKAFLTLLEPNCEKRILLFVGRSGAGKTLLMRKCRETICYPACYVPIQFRGTMVGIPEVFWRVGDCLGWDSLPEFTNQISVLNGKNINITKNKIRGSENQIRVVMMAENLDAREERRAVLTQALFEDLHNMDQPLLMAMDTYEQATTEVKNWISGPFLVRVANTSKVRVALAGQDVPDANTIEWGHCCEMHELFGVHEAKHWLPVVKTLGCVIRVDNPLDWLAGICHALNGQPDEIMKVIQALPRKHY